MLQCSMQFWDWSVQTVLFIHFLYTNNCRITSVCLYYTDTHDQLEQKDTFGSCQRLKIAIYYILNLIAFLLQMSCFCRKNPKCRSFQKSGLLTKKKKIQSQLKLPRGYGSARQEQGEKTGRDIRDNKQTNQQTERERQDLNRQRS